MCVYYFFHEGLHILEQICVCSIVWVILRLQPLGGHRRKNWSLCLEKCNFATIFKVLYSLKHKNPRLSIFIDFLSTLLMVGINPLLQWHLFKNTNDISYIFKITLLTHLVVLIHTEEYTEVKALSLPFSPFFLTLLRVNLVFILLLFFHFFVCLLVGLDHHKNHIWILSRNCLFHLKRYDK